MMHHVTKEQIYSLVDGVGDETQLRQIQAHLDLCARCRNEAAQHRRLTQIARELPPANTSEKFTLRVMARVLRTASERSLSYKLLQNLGYAFAMMIVLGVLGFILSNPSSLLVPRSDSHPSELVTRWQSFSDQFNQLLTQGTAQLNQTMRQKAGTPTWKIVSITFAVLCALVLLDRFVIRRVVRLRM